MFILLLGKIKFYHVKVAEKITTAQSSVHYNDIDRNDNNNNNIKNHGGSGGGGRSSSKRKNKPKNMVDN